MTNRHLIGEDAYFKQIEAVVLSGVDVVILREKDLEEPELLSMAERIKRITDLGGAKLIINGNIPVAEAIKADGIQLSYYDFMKFGWMYKGLKGVSIHSLEEALNAEAHGASYLLAGNVFSTDCKPGLPGRGLAWLRAIEDATDLPVIAIGGIGPDNAEEVYLAGARGIALMSSLMESENPEAYLRQLKTL